MTVTLGIREGAGRRTVSPRPSHFSDMRCSERQDRWYIFENRTEWRLCSDHVQRLLRSGELTSACSVDPFPIHFCHCSQCFSLVCATDLMTSHAWLKSKSHPHSFARVHGKISKLGSGEMGSRFREQLTHWTDPTVFSQPDQWTGFLSAMVTAHEADLLYMRNFLEEITKNNYNQGGLTLKDLKPDTFESNEKSKLSSRQWSEEFSSWVERIDQDFETLLRLAAQMQEWDKDKFTTEAQQVAEFDRHIYLAMKRLTAGITPEVVDTYKTAGEAWYRLTDRFYGRNVQGATAIASQLQELKRPTQIAKSFHLLNVIRKLVREFARQSPKEPMPSAIVKAAYMRVVPETYRRAMETQVDVDKVEPHNLEDKVLAFIRNNTSGAAPMDIGNIAPGQTPTPGLGSSSQSTTSRSHGGSDSYPDLNNYEYAAQWRQDWNTGDADTSGSSDGELYGLQKGKGKGKSGSFNGICYNCGKSGHSAKFLFCKRWKSKRKGKEGRQQRLERQ